MKIKSTLLFLLLPTMFSICDESNANKQEDLFNTEWQLYKYNDSTGPLDIQPSEGESYTLIFHEDGIMEATDACNYCTGIFEIVDGDSLIINEVSCTEIACASSSWIASMSGSFVYNLSGFGLIISRNSELDHDSYSYFFEELR
ncbi:MAG: META domain-containing protein [Candidatus Marinimicrobia bacterium]|jgi:heat shock protein HslJ|nr:META domain-containing protein [Candidatus Neomarinimicrobiota bacterium]MBT3633244.1 META domain-containing protein [Candidatus Neomarinimicrobiota bacterium]MBT3682155.1 META domain-containing protein [Candidatus Neomarinimicrobiota bacterium]MBT3758844.1 META domain-containing protein [Candidatus Neomarinimicrobiota bacterium]MBT3895281.1 META domain-containing protein [Candidatus Neomarinimicrobiota bacterium]